MLFLEIVVMVYLQVLVLIASLFLIAPWLAPVLQNVPFYLVPGDEYNTVKGRDGFFTTLQPGQVKILERGERFVTCIMRWPGYTFQYIKYPEIVEEADKWEVVESAYSEDDIEKGYGSKSAPDAYPVPSPWPRKWQSWEHNWKWMWFFVPIISLWRLWQNYMYQYFGYVFTGVKPFQTVRTYPIEYFQESTSADGVYLLNRRRNRSDHYRVAEFYYPIPLDSADTADMIPAALAVGLTTKTNNPYKLAYMTDKSWTSRYIGIARSVVNDLTRVRSIKDIVGSSGADAVEKLYEIYDQIKTDIQTKINDFGLKLNDVNTPSRKTADPRAIDRLGAPGFAAAEGEARIIEANKEAKALRLVAAAIKAHGHAGILAAQVEGRIRTVGDAGDRAIISIGEGSGGGDADQSRMLKAILAELRTGNGGDADG